MTACFFSLGDSENKPMQDRLGRPGSRLEEPPGQGQLIRQGGSEVHAAGPLLPGAELPSSEGGHRADKA